LNGPTDRPTSIEASLEYLRQREVDLDRRPDGLKTTDRPAHLTATPLTPKRSASKSSSNSSGPSGSDASAMQATWEKMRLATEQTEHRLSQLNDKFSSLHSAVAQIGVAEEARSTPNTPVKPTICMDLDDATTSGTPVCGRCKQSGHGRDNCKWARWNCSRCKGEGHARDECGIKYTPKSYNNSSGSSTPRSPYNRSSGYPSSGNGQRKPMASSECYNCHKLGHFAWACPDLTELLKTKSPRTIANIQAFYKAQMVGSDEEEG
jgi:hypothetical protein